MKARSRISQMLAGVTPLVLLAACGDDSSARFGVGGAGGAGGATSSAATSTGQSVSSTSVSSTNVSSTSTSDGGGTTTSDGGGTTSSDGGGGSGGDGGFGGSSDGGGGFGGSPSGTGGFGGFGGSGSSTADVASSSASNSSANSSSTGSGGEGGGVVVPPDGLDICPGDPFALALGTSLQLQGTTVGATSDYTSCFGQVGGEDVVFAFTLEEAGTFRLSLAEGAGLNADLVLRADCAAPGGEECVSSDFFGDAKSLVRPFIAGTYYVIVDSRAGATGDFLLSASLAAPECGDGVVNVGEACDVGPGVSGDGCTDPGEVNECQLIPAESGSDQCPGESTPVPVGESALLAVDGYSTLGYTDDERGSCSEVAGGIDRVLALEPAVSGALTVTIGLTDDGTEWICQLDPTDPQCWDQLLFARTVCDSPDPLVELDCADTFGRDRGEQITFDVIAGQITYLFVDAFSANVRNRGPFNLHFDLVP